MTASILDLFAGPGGWSTGLRMLGIDTARDEVGVEWDAHAAATARKAGHRRLVADVATLDYTDRTFTGVIGSPPCQGFSMAGKGKGRADSLLLIQAVHNVADEMVRLEDAIADLHTSMTDDHSLFALEPLRAVLATCPEWTCWEQVPAVLPLWEACADVLRAVGYDASARLVQAEQFGVPQARKRAVLRAVRGRALRPLMPTHSSYYPRRPTYMDPDVLPWVSMADALGWTEPPEPAVPGDSSWVMRRPAVSMVGSFAAHIAAAPGWRKPGDPPRQKTPGSVLLTLEQAATLQSFPIDYPWQGPATSRWRQVGDAVPPLLAAAVVASVLPD